ncbi:efflux RND transporter periplasmic adaptor subunit [Pirellulaceae bacterium SH467]
MPSNLNPLPRRWRWATLNLCAVMAGCNAPANREATSEAPSANASAIDRVSAGKPITKTLKLYTEQPGRVEAFESVPVLSKISGYVSTVHFDIGDPVKKGDVLLRIHAPEYQDQVNQKKGLLAQAEAQIKQAEAALGAANASVNSAKAMVAQAQASLARNEAEFARWESESERIQQLVSKGSVTSKLADETMSQFEASKAAKLETFAAIESARALEQEALAKVGTASADVEAAKAKRNVAEAEIQQAETMMTYTELISPLDGFVIGRKVDPGHYVQPAGSNNAQPLMTVADVSRVRVFVNVPEQEAAWVDAGFDDLTKGDSVTILGQAVASGAKEARVTRTSLQLDSQSRTLAAEIDLDNPDLKWLPGAFVTVKILLEERSNVVTLPIAAIVKDGASTVCCVVVNGKIEHRKVELGLRVGNDVQVTSGLDGTEMVVLARAGSLVPGQAVEMIVPK